MYTRTQTNGGFTHLWEQIGEAEDKLIWQKSTVYLSGTQNFQVISLVSKL